MSDFQRRDFLTGAAAFAAATTATLAGTRQAGADDKQPIADRSRRPEGRFDNKSDEPRPRGPEPGRARTPSAATARCPT